MRVFMMPVFRSALCLVLGGMTVAAVGSVSSVRVAATGVEENANAECSIQVQEAVASLRDNCTSVKADAVCAPVDAAALEARPGRKLAANPGLSEVASILTRGMDSEQWSASTIRFTWDAAVESTGSAADVTGVLFGAASITDDVKPDEPNAVFLPAKMYDQDPILLRVGASPKYQQAYRLLSNQPIQADGRNKKGDWVRIRVTNTAMGWALASQLDVTGDVMTLPELAETDITPYFLYQKPFQSFRLNASMPDVKDCADASNGLLLQRNFVDGQQRPVHFMVNGVEVSFGYGILLLRATMNDALSVNVLTGAATVGAYGKSVELADAESVQVRLNADGLSMAAPKQKTKLSFGSLVGVPTGALPVDAGCYVGVLQGEKPTRAHSGPGEKDYTPLLFLNADAIYTVLGQNKAADGSAWWKIANPRNLDNWVAQANVHTVGACQNIKVAEVGFGGSAADAGGVPGGGGFAPATRTVWSATPGDYSMEGTCSASIYYCAHPVSMSPAGSGLSYRGMDPKAYFLRKVRENAYAFSGRNHVGDGNISINLVFSSATSYSVTQVLVRDSEPDCKHINVFNGVFVR